MMQELLMKDHFTYALVIGTIILSVTAGYFLGHQDKAVVCAQYITDLDKEKQAHLKTVDELTTCKAKASGACVLDCVSVCDKQVQEALKNKKDWICND